MRYDVRWQSCVCGKGDILKDLKLKETFSYLSRMRYSVCYLRATTAFHDLKKLLVNTKCNQLPGTTLQFG